MDEKTKRPMKEVALAGVYGPITANQVRVWMDVARGTATAQLIQDGVALSDAYYTCSAGEGGHPDGVELRVSYPESGPTPEAHTYTLNITGDAVGDVSIGPPAGLAADT